MKLKRTSDKKTALATSAAVTLFLASTGLALAVAGVFDAEPAGRHAVMEAASRRPGAPTTVVETRYVDDPYYIPGATPAADDGLPVAAAGAVPGAPAAASGAGGPWPTAAATASATPAGTPAASGWSAPAGTSTGGPSAAAPAAAASPAASPTTARPATTTTVRPTTVPGPTTTLPSGARIPADWPANKPIPPVPAGCRKPVLEDNGVWNCEH